MSWKIKIAWFLIGVVFIILSSSFIRVVKKIKLNKNIKLAKKIILENGCEIELLPCPFCGGTHQQIIKQIQNNVKTYTIICDVTEGGCGASVGYSEEPLDVILAWNERYGHIYGNIKLLE